MAILTEGPVATASGDARSAGWVLAALSAPMLLSSLGTSIANVGLPALADAFDASFAQVQWIVLSYLIAITGLVVVAGRLGDLVGRRRLLLAGLAVFTLGSALCGAAPSLATLIVARAVQGLGAATMMALTMALVAETVSRGRVGRTMGLLGTMSAVGTALGPVLGGLLIAGPGWRALFLLNLPLGMVAIFLAWRYLPSDQGSRRRTPVRFDTLGTVVLVGTLMAYALAMTTGSFISGETNLFLIVAAAIGVVTFLHVERTAPAPLVRLAQYRDSTLGAGFAMSALATAVVMATLVVGPFFLSRGLELDPASVGLVMSVGPIVAALAGLPAGSAVDLLGPQRMIRTGLVGMLAGTAAMALVAARYGALGYVLALAVVTAGYALFQAANNAAVMLNVAPDGRGAVSGLLGLSRNLGLITGASAMGSLYSWGAALHGASLSEPEAAVLGMRFTFVVASIFVSVAIFVSWLAARRIRVPRADRNPG